MSLLTFDNPVFRWYAATAANALADLVCASPNVTRGQIVNMVLRYADQHPQDTHLPLATIVSRAIVEAWPRRQ